MHSVGRASNESHVGTASGEYLFAGQEYDSTLGYLYLRARYYDPTLGRFISKDPLVKSAPGSQGYNRYAYVTNDPTNAVDPSGLCPAPEDTECKGEDFVGAGGGGVGGAEGGALPGAAGDPTSTGTCPLSTGQWIDANEAMSAASRAYQDFITGTDKVWLQNGVKFDGVSDETLIEAKGSYANFVDRTTGQFKRWFSGNNSLAGQAGSQLAAAGGKRITWYFSDRTTLSAVRFLFDQVGIKGIDLVYRPME